MVYGIEKLDPQLLVDPYMIDGNSLDSLEFAIELNDSRVFVYRTADNKFEEIKSPFPEIEKPFIEVI
jgi:hypothetical protein